MSVAEEKYGHESEGSGSHRTAELLGFVESSSSAPCPSLPSGLYPESLCCHFGFKVESLEFHSAPGASHSPVPPCPWALGEARCSLSGFSSPDAGATFPLCSPGSSNCPNLLFSTRVCIRCLLGDHDPCFLWLVLSSLFLTSPSVLKQCALPVTWTSPGPPEITCLTGAHICNTHVDFE